MNLTQSAHTELSRLLSEADQDCDGFALYFAAAPANSETVDPGQTIWETREPAGWKLKLVPVSHLPTANLDEVRGIRFFPSHAFAAHELDFDGRTFLVDGKPI